MSARKPTLGISDDYAILKASPYHFYYGYEETVSGKPEENENYEWAFVVKKGKETLVRWAKSEVIEKIGKHSRDDLWGAETMLLEGIGAFILEQGLDND